MDNKGRWQKGISANPGGLTPRQIAMKRRLEGLTLKAVDVLEEVMATGTPGERLAAAREVFDRAVGRPKTAASIEVTHSASPHLAALVTLAASTAARVQTAPGNHPQLVDIAGPLTIDNQLTDVDVDEEEAVSVDVDRST